MKQRIDEVLLFHASNPLVFENLIADAKTNGIMPFVGEDLIKCIYGSRDDFVRSVEKITPTKIEGADLTSVSFLETLNRLISIHKKNAIDRKLQSFYSESKIDDMYLKNQAISLVPYINGRHCITANLDNAINHAYVITGKNPDITHPFQRKKLNSLVRNNEDAAQSNIVLKIHGDILSNQEHRVITLDDYENHYKESSDFYTTIAQWLQSYTTLFIGVDICKDKYLFDLLKQLHSPGANHYAIIGCRNEEEEKKKICDQLEEVGVQPILYDINRIECIEMLLHKFLMDTDNMPLYPMEEIDYKYCHQDLVGRDFQIEKLSSFLNASNRFLWTILVGDGITGRTKLAYEFSRLYAPDWEWYIIEPEEIDEFIAKQEEIQNARRKNRKLLVTFDNFHWYQGSLDKIFSAKGFMNVYSEKIRFIFILDNRKLEEFQNKLRQCSLPKEKLAEVVNAAYKPFPIKIMPLTGDEIEQMCRGYVYYRRTQLGIDEKIKEVLELISPELSQFIQDLLAQSNPNILQLSLLKAINLIKKWSGDEYLHDSDLAETLFQLTVTFPPPPRNNKDFNYKEWFAFKIESGNSINLIKEYFNNKEKIKETGNRSLEDNPVFKYRLDGAIGERGEDDD